MNASSRPISVIYTQSAWTPTEASIVLVHLGMLEMDFHAHVSVLSMTLTSYS